MASLIMKYGLWMHELSSLAHRLSCSTVYRVFLEQRSNARPGHWQADSQPLDHQWLVETQLKTQFPIFKGYTPFIVIIKYCIHSLCFVYVCMGGGR